VRDLARAGGGCGSGERGERREERGERREERHHSMSPSEAPTDSMLPVLGATKGLAVRGAV
jgi:hypothetical protein